MQLRERSGAIATQKIIPEISLPASIVAVNAPPPAEQLLCLYRTVTRIRAFENAAEETSPGAACYACIQIAEPTVKEQENDA